MLHIEQPHPDRSGENGDGQLHREKRPKSDGGDEPSDDARGDGVRRHRAHPCRFLGALRSSRHPVLNDEQKHRPDPEHDEGVPVGPVFEALPAAQSLVFAHRERRDVADAAMVEIARACMMLVMGAAPNIVRGEGEDTERPPGPIVRRPAREKRAMPAIVLNHEQPHEKTGRRQRQEQGQPEAHAPRQPRGRPQRRERNGGDRDLRYGAPIVLLAVFRQPQRPGLRSLFH